MIQTHQAISCVQHSKDDANDVQCGQITLATPHSPHLPGKETHSSMRLVVGIAILGVGLHAEDLKQQSDIKGKRDLEFHL